MLSLLFSVFMGALIGYGTNTLAVEMLFRPFYPKFIGKWQLPFTPGLIPKEQARIAKSLGNLIETQLFSPAALQEVIASEQIGTAMEKWLEDLYQKAASSEKSPEELLKSTLGEETYSMQKEKIEHAVYSFCLTKIEQSNPGQMLARHMAQRTEQKLPILKDIGLVNVYAGTLGKTIDRELSQSLPGILQDVIQKEGEIVLHKPLAVILGKESNQWPTWKGKIKDMLQKGLMQAVPQLLGSGEIARFTESRINSLDPKELNLLLKEVMKKELAAIEWLGALLGGILGLVTHLAGKLF